MPWPVFTAQSNRREVYIPYCTGDMHSGTKLEPSSTLGGFYFSGHLQIAGVVADLKVGG